jgi:succinate dehydrogenase hydrophobic anchor subunit
MTAAAPGAPVGSPLAGEAEVRSWGWHLLRVSSWLLAVLVPLHLVSLWLVHDPGRMGVAVYVDRWRSTGWRLTDWLFFVLALTHGGIGLNGILGTLTRHPRARLGIAIVLGLTFGTLCLAVSAAIFSFDL